MNTASNIIMIIKTQESRAVHNLCNPSFYFTMVPDPEFPSLEMRKAFYNDFGIELENLSVPLECEQHRRWLEDNSKEFGMKFVLWAGYTTFGQTPSIPLGTYMNFGVITDMINEINMTIVNNAPTGIVSIDIPLIEEIVFDKNNQED